MTDAMMKRQEALEAVAEAAEILAHSAGVIRGRTPEDADIYTHELEHIRHLMAMLSTLDALPASPPAIKAAALEKAAVVADEQFRNALNGAQLASAIRALKETRP